MHVQAFSCFFFMHQQKKQRDQKTRGTRNGTWHAATITRRNKETADRTRGFNVQGDQGINSHGGGVYSGMRNRVYRLLAIEVQCGGVVYVGRGARVGMVL